LEARDHRPLAAAAGSTKSSVILLVHILAAMHASLNDPFSVLGVAIGPDIGGLVA